MHSEHSEKPIAPGALETDSTIHSVRYYGTTQAQPSIEHVASELKG